ncbi:MAG: hypothetical protein M0016_06465 [Deltaproteobacteria bacterium]|jgi:hypothetical protein|nr:hypothetical protein [Deltaproteobacteria bacterium]MCL5880162.1 hypothetical protein [Deltaproteobacteria bacterium]MDA8304788.1 hypothetical protein [Deltaproteobacteria bacterium]
MVKIYGRLGSGMPAVEGLIREFLLKRESFKLYNIDNFEQAYIEFSDITRGDINAPEVLVIDEKGDIYKN